MQPQAIGSLVATLHLIPSSDVLSVTTALCLSFRSLVLDVTYKELGELPRPPLGLLVLVFDEPPHKIQQHLGYFWRLILPADVIHMSINP